MARSWDATASSTSRSISIFEIIRNMASGINGTEYKVSASFTYTVSLWVSPALQDTYAERNGKSAGEWHWMTSRASAIAVLQFL